MMFFRDGQRPTEDDARRYVRMYCGGDIMTTVGTGSLKGGKLHIPKSDGLHSDRPLCSSGNESDLDWKRKTQTVYPIGYRPFCDRCLAHAFPHLSNIRMRGRSDEL